MGKGTPAQGKRQKTLHIRCRRCGRHSYHIRKKTCSSCGFGDTAKLRSYAWAKSHRV